MKQNVHEMKFDDVRRDPTLMPQVEVPAGADTTTYSGEMAALEADLALLEERVRLAVVRVRLTMADEVDPSQRGLLIEEGDVDLWLSQLGGQGTSASASASASLASQRWPGQAGGRLARLSQLFGLNGIERAMLLTMLAPELNLNYGNLYSYIQDDVTKKHVTLDLVVALWCEDLAGRLEARRLLAPDSTLRRHLLLSVDDSPGSPQPLLARPLLLDPRIASYLLGADDPDPALSEAVQVIVAPTQPPSEYRALSEAQLHTLEKLAAGVLLHEPANTYSPDRGHNRTRGQLAVNPVGNGASAAGTDLRPNGAGKGLIVWMRGPERLGKREVAAYLSAALRRPMMIVDTPALVTLAGGEPPSPTAPATALALKRLMQRALREAQLQGAIIYWSEADALALRTGAEQLQTGAQAQDLPADLASLLKDWQGCALFDVRTALPLYVRDGPASVELDFPAPSNQRRYYLWERALFGVGASVAPEVDLSLLTGAFRLTGDQIEAAANTAYHAAVWRASSAGRPDEACITMRDLLAACRAHSNQNLGVLARKIVPVYTWDDLVLPADRLAQLREMCLHIRHGPTVFEQWGFDRKLSRGKGLSVLFAGQPGTGKTMAAEVLANDLGLELYKIDLSGVVSKYIGETEKNLERIFQEGQTANAILFFDEADSLFGKRSEVKDSHDRYANIEISYLLQRMEEYDGIVILATNLRKNLDEAFIRRLHGAIEFPMPEEPDRLEIWRRTFPSEAPLAEDVDLEFLAKRFKLSGGNIKNIVLEAAFFAADEGRPISMAHLVRATRREHQKIGRLISEADFGPYAHLLKREEPPA